MNSVARLTGCLLAAFAIAACGTPTTNVAATSSSADPSAAASSSGAAALASASQAYAEAVAKVEALIPPKPTDFKLKLVITSKKCFGSAGCNVEFRVTPTYTGTQSKLSGSYQVIYAVKGLEDAYTNSFTVDEDFQAQLNSGESGSTKTTSVKLSAAVTEIIPA